MLDRIEIFAQSSIKISRDKIIYFDPYKIPKSFNDADLIFITHSHFDHFSEEDLRKVISFNSIIIAPYDLKESIKNLGFKDNNVLFVEPNKEYDVDGMKFSTIPAYNINKPYHPRSNNWVSYIVNIDNYVYYIAGDTDLTVEAKKVKCNVAFVPVGGVYTMNYKEAFYLINIIKPDVAIPIHYKTVVGTDVDANNFISLLDKSIKGKIFY